jgi:hypothetical protein
MHAMKNADFMSTTKKLSLTQIPNEKSSDWKCNTLDVPPTVTAKFIPQNVNGG